MQQLRLSIFPIMIFFAEIKTVRFKIIFARDLRAVILKIVVRTIKKRPSVVIIIKPVQHSSAVILRLPAVLPESIRQSIVVNEAVVLVLAIWSKRNLFNAKCDAIIIMKKHVDSKLARSQIIGKKILV